MRSVILFIFSHQYLFKPVNTAVFFYRRFCRGRGGGGSMTGQILGQAVAVTGAPSDVVDNYSSSPNGLLTQRP